MKFKLIILAFAFVFMACEKDNDDNISAVTTVNFKFTHKWEETEVSNSVLISTSCDSCCAYS